MLDRLTVLTQLAEQLSLARLEVAAMAKEYKRACERVKDLEENEIPEVMHECNLENFKTRSGLQIVLGERVIASLPPETKADALAWLEDNGHGALIKSNIVIPFDKGKVDAANEMIDDLQNQGVTALKERKVEPATLSAWADEQREKGGVIPEELIKVYVKKTVKLS